MQLVRLARIELGLASFITSDHDSLGGEDNGLTLHAARMRQSRTWRDSVLARVSGWLRRRPAKPPPPRWFVQALVKLDQLPEVTEANRVVIPAVPRQRLEAEIKLVANLLSISSQSGRTIRTPFPSVGLLPETDADRAWLEARDCFAMPELKASGSGLGTRCDAIAMLPSIHDRLGGVALLAEALSSGTTAGEIREHMRLFELAFGQAGRHLVSPLYSYLARTPYGHTEAEVQRWINGVRHPLSHADRGGFLLDAEVLAEQFRIRQAAIDVLFNKVEWRSRDARRRSLWRPEAYQGPSIGHVRQGSTPHLWFRIFDEVGVFQRLPKWTIRDLPDGFWFKWPPVEEQQAQVSQLGGGSA